MKNKIQNLRNQRILNRYFFFQQELDLKEDMLEEMDVEFRGAVNSFLKENPEFEKLYLERIRQKQEEAFQQYKEMFAEETGEELSDSKEIILSDKQQTEEGDNEESENFDGDSEDAHVEEEDNDLSKNDKEEKKWYQKLYREIVKLTHPDKIKDEQRTKMYVRATKAYEDGNYLVLVMIASQLNIEWDWNNGIEKRVKTSVDILQQKLGLIEKSVSWLWYNTDNPDIKVHLLATFLKNNMM